MKSIVIFVTVCAMLLLQFVQATAADILVIGVAPHTSARIILEMYQPLRLHLKSHWGCRWILSPLLISMPLQAWTGAGV